MAVIFVGVATDDLLYACWDGDRLWSRLQQARDRDDVEAVRKLSHGIDRGNELFRAWAQEAGGEAVQASGDQGAVRVPPASLSRLATLMGDYETATGGTVTVGVGPTLGQADRALRAAKKDGGDRALAWSEEVDARLAAEGSQDLLGKADRLDVHGFGPELRRCDRCGHDQLQASKHPKFKECKRCRKWVYHKEDLGKSAGVLPDGSGFFTGTVGKGEDLTKESPPGRFEDLPEKLKAQGYPAHSAFAIAWAQHNRSLGKDEEPLDKDLVHDDAQNPATVWRVEGPSGKGPYSHDPQLTSGQNGAVRSASSWNQPDDYNQPNPQPGPHSDFHHQDLTQTGLALNPPDTDDPNISDDEAQRRYVEWQKARGDSKLHQFAFERPEHAVDWFGQPAIDKMREHGYELTPVKAQKVWRSQSGKQVIYLPHGAQVSARKPPKQAPPPPFETQLAAAVDRVKQRGAGPQSLGGSFEERQAKGRAAMGKSETLQETASPAMSAPAPSLADEVAEVAKLHVLAERQKKDDQGKAADKTRQRLATLLRGLQGRVAELRALGQHAPGAARALADVLGAVRDYASSLPRSAPAPAVGESPAKTEPPIEGSEPLAKEPMEKGIGGAEKGREHLNLPVGSEHNGEIKVKHNDTGKASWVSVRHGQVLSQTDNHPVSSLHPSAH